MRKLTILFALLTLTAGLWAETQNVSYLSPVYNTEGVATSGIKEWETKTVEATVVTNTTILSTGWYVVSGTDVQTGSLTCQGAVRLILADGAKLTATGGYEQAAIQVSGSNSLTIYAQSTDDAQMGQLVATGGELAAGFGDGYGGSGSNITINGGVVTANGGEYAAGIGGGYGGSGSNITINGGTVTAIGGDWAAGIGGGWSKTGSNITINGGTVTATGGENAAGIGGGENSGSGSDIYVATACIVKADGTNPPTTLIEHNANEDLATKLSGKQYVTIVNLTSYKKAATDAIDAAIVGVTDAAVLAIATQAKTDINAATTKEDVVAIKTLFLAKINAITEIEAAIVGVTDETILAIATQAKTDINAATTKEDVVAIKTLPLAKINALYQILIARQGIQNAEINSMIDDEVTAIANATTMEQVTDSNLKAMTIISIFQNGIEEGDAAGYARGLEEGKAAGKAEAKAELPTDPEGTSGHTVTITKGDKTLTLVNPDKVTYGKQE